MLTKSVKIGQSEGKFAHRRSFASSRRAVFGAAQQLTERLEEAIAKQTVMFGYLSGFSTLLGQKGFFVSSSFVYQIQNCKSAPVSIF